MLLKSNKGQLFSKEEAIDLMVSCSANDANSVKKWKGFYNSLSLIQKRILVFKINRHKKTCSKAGLFEDQSQVFPCFHCGGSQLLTNQT